LSKPCFEQEICGKNSAGTLNKSACFSVMTCDIIDTFCEMNKLCLANFWNLRAVLCCKRIEKQERLGGKEDTIQ